MRAIIPYFLFAISGVALSSIAKSYTDFILVLCAFIITILGSVILFIED